MFPVASLLGIPTQNVVCNHIVFKEGYYADFDRNQLVNHPDGKSLAIRWIKEERSFQHCVMVGDGATDLATLPVVDCFIGYLGVKERATVREKAPWCIYDFHELLLQYSM